MPGLGWEIGDWEIAEEAADWIELVAVIVIVVAVRSLQPTTTQSYDSGHTQNAGRAP